MTERKYYVKAGNMYFRYWEESEYPVFVINDQPGALEHAGIFEKHVAQSMAYELGIEIEPVEKLYQMPIPYLPETGTFYGTTEEGSNYPITEKYASKYTWDEVEELFPGITEFAVEVKE